MRHAGIRKKVKLASVVYLQVAPMSCVCVYCCVYVLCVYACVYMLLA